MTKFNLQDIDRSIQVVGEYIVRQDLAAHVGRLSSYVLSIHDATSTGWVFVVPVRTVKTGKPTSFSVAAKVNTWIPLEELTRIDSPGDPAEVTFPVVEEEPKRSPFSKWIRIFVEEKGLDMEHIFEVTSQGGTWNAIPLGVVIEYAESADSMTQAQIKKTIVKIDFKNGDVLHFFKYIAQFIADNHGEM